MTIYTVEAGQMRALSKVRYKDAGMKERAHLQAMLKKDINALFRDTPEYRVMLISEEFCAWEGSKRSIDLLALDTDANLVVIELKRTEDGAHMELQALRYAAMISNMTFDRLVDIYTRHLVKENGDTQVRNPEDARQQIVDFLDGREPEESDFAQDVRIVLASADFSSELTAAVMWLNDKYGLDIRCIRMVPYDRGDGEILIDIHTFIPVAEAQDYLSNAKIKETKERTQRVSSRDTTKYDLTIAGEEFSNLGKRSLMLQMVKGLVALGHNPDEIAKAARGMRNRIFRSFDGDVSSTEVEARLREEGKGGKTTRDSRFFTREDELFKIGGRTHVLWNNWGNNFPDTVEGLVERFADADISIEPDPTTH